VSSVVATTTRTVATVMTIEAEEDDVSGHVGDEHVAHPQIAHRVDQTGDRREHRQSAHEPAAPDR
jgi:hypothetical protein